MSNKFDSINVGDKASVTHKISEEDVQKFVNLTGDDNRLHIDKTYAKSTELKIPVVHGMLGASFISTVIGTKLPGDGALWYSQSLEFHKPVRVNDEITVEAEVLQKNIKNNSLEIKTTIFNQYNQIVTSGIAKVRIINQEVEQNLQFNNEKSKIANAILLIGATGGIGKDLAIKLSENGYDIILHYNNNQEVADEIKGICEKNNVKCILVKANLLLENDIDLIYRKIIQNNFKVYGFVNCSTIRIPKIKFNNLKWENIEEQINSNLRANFILSKLLLPEFEKNGLGRIVFITSNVIETPVSEWAHYILAKSALFGLAKALAIEYSTKGITVNCVSPSMIDTNLLSDIPKKTKMLVEARTPVNRLCYPGDVTNAILFLLSKQSSFITGETIRINGGQDMI